MAGKYYSLYTRDEQGHWHHEFGDYEKKTVTDEQDDWLDHYDENGRRRKRINTHVKTWDVEPTDKDITLYRLEL
jgi:hypothetical protein